jgi:GNAT superfamily N-acetyltransferase
MAEQPPHPTPPFQLRVGTPDDAPAMAALIASFQAELTDDPRGAGAEDFLASVSEAAERDYLASPRYRYLVAERDGALLGFIALRELGHVFHLFVARPCQGQGVARALWQQARAQALAAADLPRFTVNASLRALPVYRAFGFQAVGGVQSAHGISFQPMVLHLGPHAA